MDVPPGVVPRERPYTVDLRSQKPRTPLDRVRGFCYPKTMKRTLISKELFNPDCMVLLSVDEQDDDIWYVEMSEATYERLS